MKNYFKPFQFILFIVLYSCKGNLDFIPPDLPEKLCIVGIFANNDTTRSVVFEKSFQSEYPVEYSDSIRKLSFTISSKDSIIYTYKCDTSQLRKIKIDLPGDISLITNEKYSLRAKEESTGEISSEIFIPDLPSAFSVQYSGKTMTALPPPLECHGSVNSAILDISFSAETDHYYSILIKGTEDPFVSGRINKECLIGYSLLETNSTRFEAVIPGFSCNSFLSCVLGQFFIPSKEYTTNFFNGNEILGKKCNLRIKIDLSRELFDYKKPIIIILISVPKELFLFEKSIYLYWNSLTDPFSEPVYLKGNVSGGNGIFAIYSRRDTSINLPWESIF